MILELTNASKQKASVAEALTGARIYGFLLDEADVRRLLTLTPANLRAWMGYMLTKFDQAPPAEFPAQGTEG